MRVVAIVQARWSSARLPGKVVRVLAGRPLLGHLLGRLRRVNGLDGIAIATSDAPSDDPVAAFAAREGIPCHRGPLEDVATRMLGAARASGADAFVRISGDSPLLDPDIVAQALRLFGDARPDLVSNVVRRTFPKGQSVEIVRVETFARLLPRFGAGEDREHVTPFLYRNPNLCRIVGFEREPPAGEVQLSIDTEEDFEAVERLIHALGPEADAAGLETLLATRQRLIAEGVLRA
ncbi:MAG: NTP transferase domain-containing protein [Hyphomicrobiales bacterium]|nr:NTP transferase domain-containing protein [Hyphomicrobiales bacterium]